MDSNPTENAERLAALEALLPQDPEARARLLARLRSRQADVSAARIPGDVDPLRLAEAIHDVMSWTMIGDHRERIAEASSQELCEPSSEMDDMPDLVELPKEEEGGSGERRLHINYARKKHYRIVFTEMPDEAARAPLPEEMSPGVQARLHEPNSVDSATQGTTEPRNTDETAQS